MFVGIELRVASSPRVLQGWDGLTGLNACESALTFACVPPRVLLHGPSVVRL